MKKLLILLLVHISPNAIFSQVADSTIPLREYNWSTTKPTSDQFFDPGLYGFKVSMPAPDTSRAIILVTLSPNGIAHARMGWVVIQPGKPVIYLDCRKRALKWPQVGWDWREVGGKEK